jgi:hypothetical protein
MVARILHGWFFQNAFGTILFAATTMTTTTTTATKKAEG